MAVAGGKLMVELKILFTLLLCAVVYAQRPSYAGSRPIGYPLVTSTGATNSNNEQRQLPIEARGDEDLIKRLDALPEDQQPFWYLNWKKYEELRNNPQTYPLRPSIFGQNIYYDDV